MSMMVRRGGLAILALVGTATLVSTSTGAAFALPSPTRNLNLRLPSRGPAADLEGTDETDAVAWTIRGSAREALRAAHVLMADASLQASPLAVPTRLMVVSVRIGRKPWVHVLTNARTVGDLVDALDLRARGSVATLDDRTELRPRQRVRISLIRRVRRTVVENMPFQTLIHYSRDLSAGEVRIEQVGQYGRARRTYLITFRDGDRTSNRLLAETVLSQPVDQIEVHAFPAGPASGSEYGEATWYGCDGMHAAHRTLPFGTVVTVTNLDNGATVTVTINDRGPYAEGRIIDLCDGAFAQIAPLEQGVADIKISW